MANPLPIDERYKPSNGTEGECFYSQWCASCVREKHQTNGHDPAFSCSVLGQTMTFGIDDPNYPPEWRYEKGLPVCTAFHSRDDESQPAEPRCEHTVDMFSEATQK